MQHSLLVILMDLNVMKRTDYHMLTTELLERIIG